MKKEGGVRHEKDKNTKGIVFAFYLYIESDGSIDKRTDGFYLKDAHLIKVCCAPGRRPILSWRIPIFFTLIRRVIGRWVALRRLSGFEFIEYPYENLPECENLGYLETEIGRLYVYDENIFYIENEEDNTRQCYFITGEKNFSFIFGGLSWRVKKWRKAIGWRLFTVCAFLTFDYVYGIIRENHPTYVVVGGSDDEV